MKGQPGGSQPWSRKPSGYNDLQLYQQQLMYKQLQEIQKQKQLQHLEQETWQQPSPNPLSSLSKHAALEQLPSVANEFTISDAPKYTWQNETMIGNMNWAKSMGATSVHGLSNGLSYQQDQGHSSQQADQYLYGTPVSSSKPLPSQFSNFQSISNDGLDTLTGSAGSQFQKSMQINAFNSFQSDQNQYQGQMILQDDTVINQRFYQFPSQNVRGENMSENLEQFNAFRGNHEQAGWSGGTQLKSSHFVAQEMVKLDETEQRLLFSGSDDVSSGGMYRNLLDGENSFSSFPSLQSGSWSALMQSAVAEASSSDTGLQNDLNESGFQRKELSSGNTAPFVNYEKKPSAVSENEPSVTPRTFPLFGDAALSSQEQVHSFLNRPSHKLEYSRDGELNTGTSFMHIQPSSKVVPSQMDMNDTHSQFRNPNSSQMNFRNVSVGSWTGLLCEQPSNSSTIDPRQNPLNLQESWAVQQSTEPYNMGSQTYNRMNGLRINEASNDSALKLNDHESPSSQPSHMRTARGSIHLQKDHERSAPPSHLPDGLHFGNSGASSNQAQAGNFNAANFSAINPYNSKSPGLANQHSLALNQPENRKSRVNEENHSQVWESPTNFSSRASVEVHERRKEKNVQKEVTDEGYLSTNAHASEGIDKASVLFGIQSRPSSSGNGKDQAPIGTSSSGTGRFDFYPVGNFRDNADPNAQRHNSYALGQELRNQDQGYILSSQFVNRPALSNMRNTDNKPFDSLENMKGFGKGHSGGSVFSRDSNIPNSSDESAAFLAQNRITHASQNMLELLHKLDQSRENKLLPGHVFSNRNPVSERSDTSSTPSTLQQALTLQGSGLHLRLPSQQQLPKSSRALHDHNLREKIDPAHEGQRESQDDTRQSSEQVVKENSRTGSITSSNPRFFHQQQQSGNIPLHNQIDTDEHIRDASDVSGQVFPPVSKIPSDVHSASLTTQLQAARSSMAGFSAYSTPQPLSRPSGPHQGAFSTMLQNVWSQVSGQRQVTPSFSQSVCSSQNQSTAMGERHRSKEDSACQLPTGRSDVSQGGETSSKSSPAINSSMTTPPSAHNKSKLDQNPSHSLLLNIAASGSSSHHRLKPSSVEHPNYSLLQQMQAMKALESDPSKRLGKRPKPAESTPDPQQLAAKTQTLIYGYNNAPRVPSYKELNLPASQTPSTSDSKMLCFSSNASAEESAGRKEAQPQGLTSVSLHDPHNQLRGNNLTSTSAPSIDPQMAPSWFGQFNKIKNEQILSVYGSLSDQKPARRMPSGMEVASSSGKVNDSDQMESVSRSPSAISPVDSPTDAVDPGLTQKPPKRHKTSLSARLPWHKEITGISVKLPSIGMAESSWAYAANRLIDKVDDEYDVAEDAILGFRSRRRLILTTQLIQLLFPAVPAKILASGSTLYCDSVMFLAARLALGRACAGISLSKSDRSLASSKTDMPETSDGDKDGDGSFSRTAGDLVARARKMEDDLSRFERALSIPDLRVECQDLERFSMINRFAKFHSRAQPMGVEILPTSEAAHRRMYPQRYVAAMPMQMVPPNLADGFHCFSL